MMRRPFDYYPTPSWAVDALMKHVDITGLVYEPCAGDGAIKDALITHKSVRAVITNDIDSARDTDSHDDARTTALANADWHVTNPPFSDAIDIVRISFEHARRGIAMLLRLSFAEPTDDRGPWLSRHPMTHLIVLPRISFTGDGKTDNVTAAWFVWDKNAVEQNIVIVPKKHASMPLSEWFASQALS